MNMKNGSGYFWIKDGFIDIYAKKLSFKAQATFMCLSRHADRNGFVNIGKEKIAEKLGKNRDTIRVALQELERGGFITPFSWKHTKRVGGKILKGGRKIYPLGGGSAEPKGIQEFIKESIEEKQNEYRGREQMAEGWKKSGNAPAKLLDK